MTPEFEQSIKKAFAEQGPLCKNIEGFKRRESQLQFALAVGEAIENKDVAVVEAGTGTGKTFAYLVPAILSRSRTIVSTASKTLQDQLFTKDVGRICSALAVDCDVAVLKGRNNYICKERLERLVDRGLFPEPDSYKRLKKIIEFARQSTTGDKNDIPGIPEKDPLWPWVTSTKDNCLGKSKCPHYEDCFLNHARARAREADIVIVNHHLFMADLSLKDESLGEILPSADLVIVDEAHKLADVGMDYFSNMFSLWELKDFCDEGRILGRVWVKSVDWDKEFAAVREASLGILEAVHDSLGLDYDTEHNIADIEGCAEAMDQYGFRGGSPKFFDNFKQDYKNALDIYEALLRVNPLNSQALINAGSIYFYFQNIDKSIDYYTRASEIESKSYSIYLNLGNAYAEQGNFDHAMKNYTKALELEPNNADLFNAIGLLYQDNKDYLSAIVYYEKSLEVNPNEPETYINKASAQMSMHMYREAVKMLQKALVLDNKNIKAQICLANAYSSMKDFENAEKEFNRCYEIAPGFYQAYVCHAIAYSDANRIDKAISKYKEAIKVGPDFPNAYILLGNIYVDQKKYLEALDCYKKASQLQPENAKTYTFIGNTYFMLNDLDNAIYTYRKALAFDENISLTQTVVQYAHKYDVSTEAELGSLAGIEDENTKSEKSSYTNPDDVVNFVNATNADSLAIAIGTSHGAYKRKSDTEELRFDILKRIADQLPDFPLVLHGASTIPQDFVNQINKFGGQIQNARGIPADQLRRAVEMNICKINTDSDLRLAFTAGVRQELFSAPEKFNPRDYLSVARQNIYKTCITEIKEITQSANRLK